MLTAVIEWLIPMRGILESKGTTNARQRPSVDGGINGGQGEGGGGGSDLRTEI